MVSPTFVPAFPRVFGCGPTVLQAAAAGCCKNRPRWLNRPVSPQPPAPSPQPPQPPAPPHSVHLDFCVPAAAAALFRLNVYSMLCTVCSTMHAARRVLICCTTYAVHFHSMSAPCCAYIVYYTSVPLRAALRPASAAFGELHTASLFPPTRGAAATLPPHGRGGNLFQVEMNKVWYLKRSRGTTPSAEGLNSKRTGLVAQASCSCSCSCSHGRGGNLFSGE